MARSTVVAAALVRSKARAASEPNARLGYPTASWQFKATAVLDASSRRCLSGSGPEVTPSIGRFAVPHVPEDDDAKGDGG
jgi:hypothetical protein